MLRNSFAQRVTDPALFNVLIEFTCPAGQPPHKLVSFLEAYQKEKPSWDGIEITGITVTQNPSGTVTASPSDVLAHLQLKGGLRGLEYVPHISAKGMNQSEIETLLNGLASLGVATCFVITGDKPLGSTPVFELDSLNVLQLIRRMNADLVLNSGPGKPAPTLWPGAAVGLAKYEEATCLQQLIKLEKKIRIGKAGFVITNLIFDPRKVDDFFRYLEERDLRVPVFGNVFFLHEPAARRMLDEKLPGVYVSHELYERVRRESFGDYVRRAAQQVAMWRDLGATGVDLGNVEDLELAVEIVSLANEIGSQWRDTVENISFPPPRGDLFYVYTADGERTPLRPPSVPGKRKFLETIHNQFFEESATGYRVMRFLFEHSSSLKAGQGALYGSMTALEKLGKGSIAYCQNCGDCYLPENFNVCAMGECAKGLSNVPCGDSTIDGRCGLEPEKLCAGRLIYDAARYFSDDDAALFESVNPPKDPQLKGTSSLRNFYLKLDHRKRPSLILVAELLHASIPKVRTAFEALKTTEEDSGEREKAIEYLTEVIEAQALRNPDYIDANVDDAGEGDPLKAALLMKEAVRLIHKAGEGIPPCIDSSDATVIRAGLEEYYRLNTQGAPRPLINSANQERRDFVWELMEIGPFNLVYMLMGSVATGAALNQTATPEDLEKDALEFFREAKSRGFQASQIFFDTTVVPLAVEFTRFDGPGFNHVSLEALRLIMSNQEMKGVNSILGITNLVRDFPQGRKIGLLRAYLQIAMEAGLSAAIVDVRREFGIRGPEDDEIVEIVRAFTSQDGSPGAYERMNQAYETYKTFGIRRR